MQFLLFVCCLFIHFMLCDSNPTAELFFSYQRPDDWKPQRYHFNASFQHSVAPTENENFKPINLNTNIHGKHCNQIENNLFGKDINWSEGVFGCEQKRETAGRRRHETFSEKTGRSMTLGGGCLLIMRPAQILFLLAIAKQTLTEVTIQ